MNTSVTKPEVDHQAVTPSPAKHPRTSLRADNTPGTSDATSNGPVETKTKGKAPAKGGVGKSKGKQRGRGPAGDAEDSKDEALGTQVERRAARVVAEDSLKYTADTMRCPLPGCDSKGFSSSHLCCLYRLVFVVTECDILSGTSQLVLPSVEWLRNKHVIMHCNHSYIPHHWQFELTRKPS